MNSEYFPVLFVFENWFFSASHGFELKVDRVLVHGLFFCKHLFRHYFSGTVLRAGIYINMSLPSVPLWLAWDLKPPAGPAFAPFSLTCGHPTWGSGTPVTLAPVPLNAASHLKALSTLLLLLSAIPYLLAWCDGYILCQVDWAVGYLALWLNIILSVSVRVFLDKISI